MSRFYLRTHKTESVSRFRKQKTNTNMLSDTGCKYTYNKPMLVIAFVVIEKQ